MNFQNSFHGPTMKRFLLSSLALSLLWSHLVGGKDSREVFDKEDRTLTGPVASSDTLETVKLYFAGDCTLAGHFEDYVGNDFNYPFERLSWFIQGDITMVNLENPITTSHGEVKKEFNFKMHPKYLEVLQRGGIDVVSLANNHVYDYGSQGLLDTIYFLDSVGIKHTGAGKTLDEARRPAIFDVKGFRLGYLSYYGNGTYAADKNKPGVAPRHVRVIAEDIRKLRLELRADMIIVNFHWGVEKALYPSDWQILLAHEVVDLGADLIVGHHPHVLQGIEKYKDGVIAYSLGKFLFGGNSRRTYDTAVLQVVVGKHVRQYSILPIRVKDWQPYLLEGDEAGEVLSSIKECSRKFVHTIF